MKKLYFAIALLFVILAQSQNAADIDMGFNTFEAPENQYLNEYSIKKILTAPDGQMVALSDYGITRFSNNKFDTTFNTGTGFEIISVPDLHDFAIQPDGKIIIACSYLRFNGEFVKSIIRLNLDGSRDTTFSLADTGTGYIEHINLLPDGKILINGGFSIYNGVARTGLARLNADGTLDTSFVPALNLGTYAGTVVRVQADNKILVVKKSTTSGGWINQILRLNSDGSLDNTFTEGITNGSMSDYVCQSDGKIVIIGSFISYNSTAANSIVRINQDGSIDPSFILAQGFDTTYHAESIIQQPDGKLILGGSLTSYNDVSSPGLIRLNYNGTIDTTFNVGDGFSYHASVSTLALLADGKIAVGGSMKYYNNFPINYIARVNPDGSRDATFTNFAKGFDGMSPSRFAEQNDGKLIISGDFSTYNDTPVQPVVRLNTDGSLDPSFHLTGSGFGSASIQTGVYNGVNAIKVLPDGKILCGGKFTTYNGIAVNRLIRLNSDGSQDMGFISNYAFDNNIDDLLLQPDGKIIVFGRFTGKIIRLSPNGSQDPTFVIPNISNYIDNVVLQADGKILVSGSFSSIINSITYKCLLRLNSDGSIDPSFHIDFTPDSIFKARLQPDNKIVIMSASTFGAPYIVKRLNSNGTTDNTFTAASALLHTYNFLLLENGKILTYSVLAGGFTSLKRMNSNGSLDSSYGYDPENGLNGGLVDMFLQSDQKIVAVGNFSHYRNIPARRIIRFMGESAEPLAVENFTPEHFFTLYPNPTKGILNIAKKEAIDIRSISIFNMLGQQVIHSTNAQNLDVVDVSALKSGSYFLKINTDKGIFDTKFIKL